MKPTLDYRPRGSAGDDVPAHLLPRRSVCGRLSVAAFALSVCLFVYSLKAHSPQERNTGPAYAAFATMGTSLIGFVLGIAGRVAKERDRDWVVAGIVLNGAWLMCGGIFLLVGSMIFGGSRGSDWH